MQSDVQDPVQKEKVVSPFAHNEAVITTKRGGGGKMIIAMVAIAVLLVLGVVGVVSVMKYTNDPYRTLENFPVSKYLESYHALAGSKFKGELKVEADLGFKEGVGRLMLFSTPTDSRPIAVMIPPTLASIYFTKGQSYLATLEVHEGGLIYAVTCKKN